MLRVFLFCLGREIFLENKRFFFENHKIEVLKFHSNIIFVDVTPMVPLADPSTSDSILKGSDTCKALKTVNCDCSFTLFPLKDNE